MSTRYACQRQRRVIAGFLLAIGVVLACVSVTPAGALRCLHCFLAQRWVEATVSEPVRQKSRAEPRPDRAAPAPPLDAPDSLRVPQRLTADPQRLTAPGEAFPDDTSVAIPCPRVCDTGHLPAARRFDEAWPRAVMGSAPTIPGFRAPPSFLST
ncbi:MAG TPA: hypothetical protein PLT27_15890 [Nitrospira sp.]|nr:hypothetical protein [Nitrospira sp.]